MTRLALATCQDEPKLFRDEAPLVAALTERGVSADPCIWNDPNIMWASYDAIVIRNTWDYHYHAAEFERWLRQLEAAEMRIINPPSLLRWNMNKRYLQELAECGIAIVPTRFVTDTAQSLTEILTASSWSDIIIKPIIGASGDDTIRLNTSDAASHQTDFERIVRGSGALIQPFMPQIHEGEWSLIFFKGAFSHAVIKHPATGSIFVHEERGGTTRPITADATTIAAATTVMQQVEALTGIQPVYARVDGLLVEGEFLLMEIECVEPELFMLHNAEAGATFADALLQAL